MIISKSSLYNGEMRWSAVNSDTDWDLYGERMTLELYKGMIAKIKSNVPPPEPFAELVTSDYWKGGMPYLSIAHYSDGNGNAVPGDVRELFIDGNQLKAKGTLHDTPLGKAVWKSIKQDEVNYKNDTETDRIRISIAFLDLAHKHGEDGAMFRRKSFTDVCPECQRGVGEKIYVDGYLVHLALTRVPVNPRTIFEEDTMAKKSDIKTKKDDAISVLGGDAELAEQVEKSGLEFRSDAIIEMSETPEAIDSTEPVEEKSYGEVEQVQIWKPYGGATSMKEAKKFVEAQQESWRVSDLYYTFTDVARNIMDSDEIEDKAGALATLVDEFKKSLVAKSLYEELSQIKEGTLEETYMTVKKSDLEKTVLAVVAKATTKEEPVVEKSADGDMDEEEKKKKAKEDKMKAEKSDTVSEPPAPVQKSALDVAVDELYNVVNGVITKAGTSEEKLQEVQPALQNLGSAIVAVVKSSTNEAVAQPLPQNDAVLEAINGLKGLVSDALTEVATLKAQIANPAAQPTSNRVPVPRSITPTIVKSEVPQNTQAQNPNSISNIVRRSVGL